MPQQNAFAIEDHNDLLAEDFYEVDTDSATLLRDNAAEEADDGARKCASRTVRVRETVPEYFTNLGSLDAWRMMARQRAFETMFQQIKPTDIFQAQCFLSEAWENTASGVGKDLIIVCDLNFWIEESAER